MLAILTRCYCAVLRTTVRPIDINSQPVVIALFQPAMAVIAVFAFVGVGLLFFVASENEKRATENEKRQSWRLR